MNQELIERLRNRAGTLVVQGYHGDAQRMYEAADALEGRVTITDDVPEWNRADGDRSVLLYTLVQDGWRRGEPVMVNDVMVRIERAPQSDTPIEPIVRRILSALSAPAQRVEEGWQSEPSEEVVEFGTKFIGGGSTFSHEDRREIVRNLYLYITGLAASSAPAPHAGVDVLTALADHTNWELTCGPVDDDLTTLEWQVHQRNGGVNDREWTRLSIGETPEEALRAALEHRT